MKKSIYSLIMTLLLTACATGITDEQPVVAGHYIKNLCVNGNFRAVPKDFLPSLETSLQRKGMNIVKASEDEQQIQCDYLIRFKGKGNKRILAMVKVDVIDLKNGKNNIGTVLYERRGEEKARVKELSLQGQTDLIINHLFKNY
ncbi:hypothetical protein [Volucribacter amazonae]|uniref:Lipoprotein n=1 Tax=Volucribacter amazonae TaxID=256731 RepID=A0A9X4PFF3_9PAST|nr:hypothetical protein [Volucribacter amazonae]MDG6896269.1 hypothetical protein [Volucribacter amazonae]